jgi:hypothetical protein
MTTFLHYPLLWGLLLAGVPVLIHLINMLRQRRVPWAAMEFLLASQKKHRTWIVFKQLLLLLLRMAAVAAVVLMLAQPLLQSGWGAWIGGGRTHHVVLLDDSFSMSDRWEDTSAFEQAKGVVRRIVEQVAREGAQTFTLQRFSQAGRPVRGTQPDFLQEAVDSTFSDRLTSKLAELAPSQTAAGPLAAMEAVAHLLGQSEGERRIVYLVSDFRARQWDDPGPVKKTLLDWAAAGVKIRFIDCVESARPNLAIRQLAPGPGTRAAGVPLFMEVTVENFGGAPVKDVPVLIEADELAQPALSIAQSPPHRAVKERFPVRFAAAGQHRMTVRLEADAVLDDNFRYAVVDFPMNVPVLLVDGDPEAQDARYLSSVFAPGGPAGTGISPRIETPRYVSLQPLEPFQAVYLLNVDRLERSAIGALEQYVANGGGVGIFLGERSSSQVINDGWHRQGQGLFPLPVEKPAELAVDYLQRIPDLVVTDHPIFQVLAGDRNSFLPLVIVRRYFSVPKGWRADADSGTSVIARLRNGAPLAVERRFGRGRVVAFLTTAAPAWNNWARENPSFVVSMLELQAYLTARPAAETPRLVGQPLELKLDPAQYEPQVRFTTPKEDVAPTSTLEAERRADGQLAAILANTDASGIYRARLARKDGKEEIRSLAVNVEADEGDLRTLAYPDLAARLEGVPHEYQLASAYEYSSEQQGRYYLGTALLSLVVVLLTAELLLAYSASYHPPKALGAALPTLPEGRPKVSGVGEDGDLRSRHVRGQETRAKRTTRVQRSGRAQRGGGGP